MKIDFSQNLVNLDGEIVKDVKQDVDSNGQRTSTMIEVTLGKVCANALMLPKKEEESGDVKARKYDLAIKVYKGGELDIDSEDISILKKEIGRSYGPMIVGQVYKILEGQN